MDRRKSQLQPRLVIPLVILGSAFALWSMFVANRPGSEEELGSTVSPKTSSRNQDALSDKMRVQPAPPIPRLLPSSKQARHIEKPSAASAIETVRTVDSPLIDESANFSLVLKMVEQSPEEQVVDNEPVEGESSSGKSNSRKAAEEQLDGDETVAEESLDETFELELSSPPPIDSVADEQASDGNEADNSLDQRTASPPVPAQQASAPSRQYAATSGHASEANPQKEPPQIANPGETPPQTARPQYSWLLEGQAEVPIATRPRSRELERIAQEADAHTRRGFDLAGRKAYYSARAEFIKALRLVAQGLDVEHQTPVHNRALHAGLTALDEADDFVPSGPQLKSKMNLEAIIEGHDTPVLKLARPQALTTLEALRRYYSFAQYQLAVAAGREVAGSMALHALAKLYAASEDNPTLSIVSAKSKAMTCFQAALVAFPKNYMASNDLGVLLANAGRFNDAKTILEESAANTPHSTTWHNLAVVYRELGMSHLAARAEANHRNSLEQETAQRNARSPGASDPRVVWLSPEDFAKTYARTADARQPLPARTGAAMSEARTHPQAPVQVAEYPEPATEKKKTSGWSWNIFQKRVK